ncbi:hypothetical protein [Eisenibacter elegans]|uniref:hypothetical protein n=1 Tax=Eisenibacter elegans TaxID=997 RepID=UPI00041C295C|nr:hypothetical protein [Eisenibacter elegans]
MKTYALTFLLSVLCYGSALAQAPVNTRFKPEKGMIDLREYHNQTLTLKTGQRCYYQYTILVEAQDYTAAFLSAENPNILSMRIEEGHWFRSPLNSKADRVNVYTSVFEAQSAGKTTLYYQEEDLRSGETKTLAVTVMVKEE